MKRAKNAPSQQQHRQAAQQDMLVLPRPRCRRHREASGDESGGGSSSGSDNSRSGSSSSSGGGDEDEPATGAGRVARTAARKAGGGSPLRSSSSSSEAEPAARAKKANGKSRGEPAARAIGKASSDESELERVPEPAARAKKANGKSRGGPAARAGGMASSSESELERVRAPPAPAPKGGASRSGSSSSSSSSGGGATSASGRSPAALAPSPALANRDAPLDEALEADLRCGLCLSTLFKPVVLSCGHACCRLCLLTAIGKLSSEFFGRFRCPQCRRVACNKCLSRFQVCSTLWAVTQRLCPALLLERGEAQEQREFSRQWRAWVGSSKGGAHGEHGEHGEGEQQGGRQLLVRKDRFKLFKGCDLSRTVVRDEQDLAMRLALAVERQPDPVPAELRRGERGALRAWAVHCVLLELEEDEDGDSYGGFPGMVAADGEVAQFMRRTAFAGTLKGSVFTADTTSSPLRLVCQAAADLQLGQAVLRFDAGRLPPRFARVRVEIESEQFAGLKCNVDLRADPEAASSQRYSGWAFRPPRPAAGSAAADDGDADGSEGEGIDIMFSDDESEPEELDQFEQDGFIVDGDEEDEEEDEDEDEDEDGSSGDEDGRNLRSDQESVDSLVVEARKKSAKAKSAKAAPVPVADRRRPRHSSGDDDSDSDSGSDSDEANQKYQLKVRGRPPQLKKRRVASESESEGEAAGVNGQGPYKRDAVALGKKSNVSGKTNKRGSGSGSGSSDSGGSSSEGEAAKPHVQGPKSNYAKDTASGVPARVSASKRDAVVEGKKRKVAGKAGAPRSGGSSSSSSSGGSSSELGARAKKKARAAIPSPPTVDSSALIVSDSDSRS